MNHIYRIHHSLTAYSYVDIIAENEDKACDKFWNEDYDDATVKTGDIINRDIGEIKDLGPAEIQISMFDES